MAMAGRCGAAAGCIMPTVWASRMSATGWPSMPTGRVTRPCGLRRCCNGAPPNAAASRRDYTRHSRESGNPAPQHPAAALGPRFRGGDATLGVRVMDLRLTPEELGFRDEVRAFFRANLPERIRTKLIEGRKLAKDDIVTWQRTLNKQGWAVANWPVEWGGIG